jgi:hypothetical protein
LKTRVYSLVEGEEEGEGKERKDSIARDAAQLVE